MVPAILLTPLILAAEPVQIPVPDRSYDHYTQTSRFHGDMSTVKKARFTSTRTQSSSGSYDTDSDQQ